MPAAANCPSSSASGERELATLEPLRSYRLAGRGRGTGCPGGGLLGREEGAVKQLVSLRSRRGWALVSSSEVEPGQWVGVGGGKLKLGAPGMGAAGPVAEHGWAGHWFGDGAAEPGRGLLPFSTAVLQTPVAHLLTFQGTPVENRCPLA